MVEVADRIPLGAEVEWVFSGQGIMWRRGRVIAFVPAGQSAHAHVPRDARRAEFADRSRFDRYVVAVHETGRIRFGQRETGRVLRTPLYCAPTAALLERYYRKNNAEAR